MKERYEYLFRIYLQVCTDPENLDTSDQLRDRIRTTDSVKNQLYGMLVLMKEMAVLNQEEEEQESERIRQAFSPIALFGAYIDEDGELYRFREVNGWQD